MIYGRHIYNNISLLILPAVEDKMALFSPLDYFKCTSNAIIVGSVLTKISQGGYKSRDRFWPYVETNEGTRVQLNCCSKLE